MSDERERMGGTCNCCDNGTERSAWCNDCPVRYVGDSDPAGLVFHCVTHRRDIVIAITFDLGTTESASHLICPRCNSTAIAYRRGDWMQCETCYYGSTETQFGHTHKTETA